MIYCWRFTYKEHCHMHKEPVKAYTIDVNAPSLADAERILKIRHNTPGEDTAVPGGGFLFVRTRVVINVECLFSISH